MISKPLSHKFKSLYVARFLLEMAGVFLLIFAIFAAIVLYPSRNAGHGGYTLLNGILKEAFILAAGIGPMLPGLRAKFFSSLSLVGAGAWLFCIDAYRSKHPLIYGFFLVPLALTIWLCSGYNEFKVERLPNANQLSN